MFRKLFYTSLLFSYKILSINSSWSNVAIWFHTSVYDSDNRYLQDNTKIDIHKIERIWTRGAIGWTVSRLNILFHAPQTRRLGGLHSQSASCWSYIRTTQWLTSDGIWSRNDNNRWLLTIRADLGNTNIYSHLISFPTTNFMGIEFLSNMITTCFICMTNAMELNSQQLVLKRAASHNLRYQVTGKKWISIFIYLPRSVVGLAVGIAVGLAVIGGFSEICH